MSAVECGVDDAGLLKYEHNNLLDIESLARLDVILDMIETAASVVSGDVVAINGDGPEKLYAVHELALRNKTNKTRGVQDLASQILAILARNDHEDDEERQPEVILVEPQEELEDVRFS